MRWLFPGVLGEDVPRREVLKVELHQEIRSQPGFAARSVAYAGESDREIAAYDKRSPQLRAEAILGTDDAALLQKLGQSENAIIREEAQRALPRSIAIKRPALDDTAAWLKLLEGQGDVETGRRIFFNTKAALCSNCHRHSGRGNVVGPHSHPHRPAR